jgi:myo-inositol-1(or 4)-monophosphatase
LPESERAAELSTRLETAVREAGGLALSRFGKPMKIWSKGGDSPVSEADIAVDQLLRERLTTADPDFGWLSEESVEDGRPILAAVYAPASEEMFFAAAGTGTTCNGIPTNARDGRSIDGAMVAGPKRYLQELASVQPGLIQIAKIHSLALRIARVAQGQIDVALASGNGHDWDLAAADLLVHEANGVLTTFAGERLVYNRPNPVHGALVAAATSRHRALSSLLREQRRAW